MRRRGEEIDPKGTELEYETGRMGRISGGLWTLGATMGIVGALLPGASHGAIGWVIALSVVVFAYGVASVTGLIPWERASVRTMAIGIVVTRWIGLAIYLTGASLSYIEPLLVCSLLYISFFFPARWAWPLTVELLLVAAVPLLYDGDAVANAFLPRWLALAAGFLAITGVTLKVRQRLVDAERSQRELANRDSLTGVPNRRAFDQALARELEDAPPIAEWDGPGESFAVLILDLDDFKSINDVHGHLIGDAVLRGAAQRAAQALRATDLLARIGGDEFAVIAPPAKRRPRGRWPSGCTEVSRPERSSNAPVPRVTVGWGVFPDDGESAEALMGAADRRLFEHKRGRGEGRSVVPLRRPRR